MCRTLSCIVLFYVCLQGYLVAQGISIAEAQLAYAVQTQTDSAARFRSMLKLANFYQQTNIHKADSISEPLVQLGRVQSDSFHLVSLLFRATMEEQRGDIEAYLKTTKKCTTFLTKMKKNPLEVFIYQHLGQCELLKNQYAKALISFQKMLQLASSFAIHEQRILAHLLLAKTYKKSKDQQLAFSHVDSAMIYAKKDDNQLLLATCFHFKAKICQAFEQVESSVENGILAAQMAKQAQAFALSTTILIESGLAELTFRNVNEAEHLFNRAVSSALHIHDDTKRAWARLGLAQVYLAKKQTVEAVFQCKRAIAVYEQVHSSKGLGPAYKVMGTIYQERQNHQLALNYYTKALAQYTILQDMSGISEVYHHMGMNYYQEKRYNKALNYLTTAGELCKKHQLKSQEYRIYRSISTVYEAMHHYQEALRYQKKYMHYFDTNAVESMINKVVELHDKYSMQQLNQRILLQTDSIEKQRHEHELMLSRLENSQLRNNFQIYIILGFILITLLGGVILYVRFRQLKEHYIHKEIEINLAVLRAQMNPHFIFNAMSVIQSFIYDNNTEKSSLFIVKLSRLIRLILENSTKKEISIELEESILINYLQIQSLRFDHKFDYSIEIDEQLKKEHVMIPPMITQPFVENAIEHGQLHSMDRQGYIHIRFEKVVSYHILNMPYAPTTLLQVTIEDNGVGRAEQEKDKHRRTHKSMSIEITQERINMLNKKYRTSGYLKVEDLDNHTQQGTKVILLLPYITEQMVRINELKKRKYENKKSLSY